MAGDAGCVEKEKGSFGMWRAGLLMISCVSPLAVCRVLAGFRLHSPIDQLTAKNETLQTNYPPRHPRKSLTPSPAAITSLPLYLILLLFPNLE